MEPESEESQQIINDCGCLPDCYSIEYEQNLVVNKFKTNEHTFSDSWSEEEYVGLRFYFGADEYAALKRHATYGTVSFLSNCGGLLGLFLGMSALSVIEVFYFFVIRLTSDFIRKFRRHTKVEPFNRQK